MSKEPEQWKDIKGYETKYKISNYGNILSLKYKNPKLRKLQINKYGYNYITIWKNGKQKNFLIHRLVAIYFVSNSENKEQVNHLDGNKLNNYVGNLEWCTASENIQHAYTNNLNNRNKKIFCPELNQEFISIRKAAQELNIAHPRISECCRGLRKFIGKHTETGEKLTWKYK